jgi:hypothetical protein
MGRTAAAAITISSSSVDNMLSGEDAYDIIKIKEQNRQEGKRRALAIAIAKQQQQQKLQGSNNESSNNTTNTTTTSNRRGNNRKSDRHGARNQHRHKHFARWILQTFPHVVDECTCCSSSTATMMTTSTEGEDQEHKATSSTSSSTSSTSIGTHILDIAGGKGELSARLSLCHSLRIRMIDPRPANISDVYMNSVVPKLPKKWQISLKKRLVCRPNFVDDMVNDRFVQLVTHFTIDAPSSPLDDNDDDNIEDEEGRRLFQDESVEDAVRNASLIIGLHADGATEAIVDAALRYNKPFVVVPCCVFPNFFRDRFIFVDNDEEDYNDAKDNLSGGNSSNSGDRHEKKKKRVAVRTHEQFCQYLLDKDDRFRKEILPFEGRNVAIWWDGK